MTRLKKILIAGIGLCMGFTSSAYGLSVSPKKAGRLAELVEKPEGVESLSVTGPIDATDIYFISSSMPALQQLDLSKATVAPYSGRPLRPAHTGIHEANAIPPYAFMGCRATEIKLPADTRKIGYAAFAGTSATQIELPDKVTEIGAYAFQSSALTSIVMPPSVTAIGEGAFQKCNSLVSATIPQSLTSIGDKAFEGSSVTSLDFSNCTGLKHIGRWAFASMTQLTTVILPTGITDMGHGTFMGDKSLTQIVLSDQLGKLPALMLYGTEAVTSVKIPAATDSIGTLAMGAMMSLTSIDASAPRSVPGLETDVWGKTPVAKVILYVPERLVNHYSTTDQWRDFIIEGVSGIDAVSTDGTHSATITRNGDALHIEATDIIKSARLIDCSGKILYELAPDATSCDIDIARMSHGVYIVQYVIAGVSVSSTKISI